MNLIVLRFKHKYLKYNVKIVISTTTMNVCTIIMLNVYLCLCHRTCDEAEEQQKHVDFKHKQLSG